MFPVELSVNGPSHEKYVGEKSEVYRIALLFYHHHYPSSGLDRLV